MRAERRATAAGPLLLVVLLGLAGVPAAARENPHAFMDDPAHCLDCHEKTPVRGKDDFSTVTFKDTIVSLCSKCHGDDSYREEHPVELRPESAVPEGERIATGPTSMLASIRTM